MLCGGLELLELITHSPSNMAHITSVDLLRFSGRAAIRVDRADSQIDTSTWRYNLIGQRAHFVSGP